MVEHGMHGLYDPELGYQGERGWLRAHPSVQHLHPSSFFNPFEAFAGEGTEGGLLGFMQRGSRGAITRERELNLPVEHATEAEKALKRTQDELALMEPLHARQRELERRRFTAINENVFGELSTAGQRFDTTAEAAAIRERRMESAGGRGYGRGAEQEDIAREMALAEKMAHARTEAVRREMLASNRVAFDDNAVREARVDLATKQAQSKVTKAGIDQLKKEGADPAKLAERRLQYEKDLVEVQAAEQRYQEAAANLEQGRLQYGETLKQNLMERVNLLKQEHATLGQLIQQEKQRRQERTEQIGLMKPRDYATSLRIAKKLHAGGSPTWGEYDYMQRHPEAFKEETEKIARSRGGPMFDELKKYLPGLTRREQELKEQRIAIESKIKMELNTNAKQVIEEVVKQLEGALFNQQALVAHMIAVAMERFGLEQRNQFRAVQGQ
jgi:hypothetical protein